jgi:hypothetical protein
MNKTKNVLWDSERLADFSNVKWPKDAQKFRGSCSDFFPQDFWRKDLRASPDDPIPEGDPGLYGGDTNVQLYAMGLLDRPDRVPLWWFFKQRLREAWQRGFPLEMSVSLITSLSPFFRAFTFLKASQVWPYQRALMFLCNEPWRARFCSQCGDRFVGDKPARRFCSATCSAKARKNSRAASWQKHGKEWRNRYEGKTKGIKSARRRRNKLKRASVVRNG